MIERTAPRNHHPGITTLGNNRLTQMPWLLQPGTSPQDPTATMYILPRVVLPEVMISILALSFSLVFFLIWSLHVRPHGVSGLRHIFFPKAGSVSVYDRDVPPVLEHSWTGVMSRHVRTVRIATSRRFNLSIVTTREGDARTVSNA